jgi:hypothetical protein
MAAKFAQGIVNRLIEHLEADLPARLDEVEAESSDGLVLEDVREWHDGERGAINYPAGWVLAESGVIAEPEENLDQLASQFPYGLWQHHVNLHLAIVDPDDPGQLRRRLLRYAQALVKLVRDHETDPEWVRARATGYRLINVMVPVEGDTLFRQGVVLTVEVFRAD